MAKGDKVLPAKHNSAVDAVNSARKVYDLGAIGGKVSSNENVNASSLNNLITWLTEARNRCGNSSLSVGASNVTAKSSILVDQYDSLISAAARIQSNCGCHTNCTNGCKGGCRGTKGTSSTRSTTNKSGY